MKKLYKRLFWKKVYSYRTSKTLSQLEDDERIVNMTMAYHNSYPAGMQCKYLIESVYYVKP